MNKFRHYLVQIGDKLYVTNILYKLWFIFLGLRNGIHIKFGQNSILLKKSTNSILIRKGKNDFGAIGIVLRDFDNFYKDRHILLEHEGKIYKTISDLGFTLHTDNIKREDIKWKYLNDEDCTTTNR